MPLVKETPAVKKARLTRELFTELISKVTARETIHAFVADVARTTTAHDTPLSGYCTEAQQQRVTCFLETHFRLRQEDVDLAWLSTRLFNSLARG